MIAVTHTTRQNGCLQVITGSHAIGLTQHDRRPEGQKEADPVRVEAALAVLPRDFIEMEPGDALFFHCNLLHKSEQNTGADPRWSFICCYNARYVLATCMIAHETDRLHAQLHGAPTVPAAAAPANSTDSIPLACCRSETTSRLKGSSTTHSTLRCSG